MKRPKRETPPLLALRGQRCLHVLLGLAVFYASLLLVSHLLLPLFARRLSSPRLHHAVSLGGEREAHRESASPARPSERFASFLPPPPPPPPPVLPLRRSLTVSGLSFQFPNSTSRFSQLHDAASHAWELGRELLGELDSAATAAPPPSSSGANRTEEPCPRAITLTGAELERRGGLLLLTCGLTLGSHITVVARPRRAHEERRGPAGGTVMVSQFMMELRGLRAVEGEDPPRILHFNPRLKGDWSSRPVIELNTCYRMQWASALRCDGRRSRPDEETVDGLVKCEKWSRDDDDWLTEEAEETTSSQLLSRPIGQGKTGPVNWPFPFVEERLFVLTLTAGFEGYHISVDGRHVTSFPYRTGFVLEDATGLSLNGDINVSSIIAGSLPTLHPSFAPQRYLEMSSIWKAPPLPPGPIDLFIGVLSAGNHFGERMAVRKSWMSSIRSSSNVVARFFVAMHVRKEVNVELKKEAEFFGDIVIVPFLDHYDLVVLKTIAICEYGLRSDFAKYIMKCDDDTFVGVDSVMNVMKKIPSNRSLYMGNMNYHTKPLRHGKWAVTYEEWPEEDYPPYANGPGYIISSDIAQDIVSEFENHTLRIFKMEDVSMGMWVEQFNKTRPVEYIHSLRFCQFGCIKNYLTAHYQSPRQMICMWDKLQLGLPECCDFR